jgi:uncharacterized membrane protein
MTHGSSYLNGVRSDRLGKSKNFLELITNPIKARQQEWEYPSSFFLFLQTTTMKFVLSVLASTLFIGFALAQSIAIGFPADGTPVTAGSSITVEIDRPVRLLGVLNLAIITEILLVRIHYLARPKLQSCSPSFLVITLRAFHRTIFLGQFCTMVLITRNFPRRPVPSLLTRTLP